MGGESALIRNQTTAERELLAAGFEGKVPDARRKASNQDLRAGNGGPDPDG